MTGGNTIAVRHFGQGDLAWSLRIGSPTSAVLLAREAHLPASSAVATSLTLSTSGMLA